MSSLTFLCLLTSVYFWGFAAFFLYPPFRCIPLFCMSTVRFKGYFFGYLLFQSVHNMRFHALFQTQRIYIFPLAVINILRNPFSLLCPPYRVYYNPSIAMIPVEWEYEMPFGVVYAQKPSMTFSGFMKIISQSQWIQSERVVITYSHRLIQIVLLLLKFNIGNRRVGEERRNFDRIFLECTQKRRGFVAHICFRTRQIAWVDVQFCSVV